MDTKEWHSIRKDGYVDLTKLSRKELIAELVAEREGALKTEADFGERFEEQRKLVRGFLKTLKSVYPQRFKKFSGKRSVEQMVDDLFYPNDDS